MPPNNTVIRGEATDKVCLDHATFMLLDNYQKDPGLLQSESAAGMREIDAKWDRVTTANIGVIKKSGFYATLYTPKDGNTCPPTLALRGTIFDDARGVALMLNVKAYPAFNPNMSQEFGFGFAPGYETPGAEEGETSFLRKIGFKNSLLAHGSWLELFKHQNMDTRVTSRIPMVLPSFPIPADYRDIVIETTFEVWLNRTEGDWAANIIQGIGQSTLHYGAQLMAAVDDAMDVADEFDGQLRITGHSLGGGLASAGAIYAKKLDPEMKIYALAYDAAGVHPNTAANLNTSLDLASDAKIIMRAVEDEVLTSIEKPADFVPILSSLLRFTGAKIPEPIGTHFIKKGTSPGPIGNSWEEGTGRIKYGHQYAPKGRKMPNVLGIDVQDLFPKKNGENALKTFANLAGQFAAASTVKQALENINNEIARRVRALQDARSNREAAEDAAERASEAADASREAAAERAEAAAEAASERAEAAREAAAEAAEAEAERAAAALEAEAEANEEGGIAGFFFNLYDEPRDAFNSIGRGFGEAADEIGDAGAYIADEVGDAGAFIADEVGDIGRQAWDELGDGANALVDAGGDALAFAYEHSAQYMVEFAKYGGALTFEAMDFADLLFASIAYHDMELATFTFVFDDKS